MAVVVIDGWYANYHDLADAMVTNGLEVTIESVDFLPPYDGWRLLAILVSIDERHVLRPHAIRNFELHVSLTYEHEFTDTLMAAARRLDARWRGVTAILGIQRVGFGGAAILSEDCVLMQDSDFRILHEEGQ